MSAQGRAGRIIALVVVAIVVLSLFSWFINTRNSMISMEESVDAAWAEIDNQLKRRNDLIPNLVNTVKGYASHEEEVFTDIADARSKLAGATSVKEAQEGHNQMEGALSRLLMITENYPQLKANENFKRLMDELAGTENRIAVARKRYNEEVQRFNREIRMFPATIIAGMLGLQQKDYFEVSEDARETPEVDFGG
jgi:LemA protein